MPVPRGSDPDVILATTLGCGEGLLRLIDGVGAAHVLVLLTKDQVEFIQANMVQSEDGRWTRKTAGIV
jgi:hypothetical protein